MGSVLHPVLFQAFFHQVWCCPLTYPLLRKKTVNAAPAAVFLPNLERNGMQSEQTICELDHVCL